MTDMEKLIELPTIVSRPWQPQDLIDDLQLMIDEEPDNYLNANRSTLCMARDFLRDFFFRKANGMMVQWISVEDEKPNTKKVIDGAIWYRHVVVLTDDPMVPEKIAYYDEDVKAWFLPMDFIPLTNVTHWMPLPESPMEN